MLFNSYAFLLFFLPAAVWLYGLVDRRPDWRIPALILLSFLFYGYWDVRFVPLLAASSVGNWLAARYFLKTKRGGVITLAITMDLAVLGYFKYWGFFVTNLNLPAAFLPVATIGLPLGISFFTFHHIMYLVDLRRGKAPPVTLERYTLYIAFFPQVLSGPLVRWHEIISQFGRAMFASGWEAKFALGLMFIAIGLCQKIFLGDTLAGDINAFYERIGITEIGQAEAWIAVFAFTFQIFFDFSGYTDVAIGVALLFGIQLPQNFNAPYRATSVREFWRRWHMTLSRFLRDYLYIPLGGNRHGVPRQIVALLLTMGLGGLWHGAGWLFILWGLLHGLALATELIWRSTCNIKVPAPLGWIATFGFVSLSWIFFRAPSLEIANRIFRALVAGGASTTHQGWRTVVVAAVCAILFPPTHVICRKLAERPHWLVAFGFGLASAAILVGLGSDKSYEFIYFQF